MDSVCFATIEINGWTGASWDPTKETKTTHINNDYSTFEETRIKLNGVKKIGSDSKVVYVFQDI